VAGSRTPLHGRVRPRVLEHAAAPDAALSNNVVNLKGMLVSAATHSEEATAQLARRCRTLRGTRTPLSNARHHGARERQ
jgi:hypothetical protein